MKINVVCHDLSNNCLGRAHVLARLLARDHDVDIVGRMRGDHLWEPLRFEAHSDSAVPVRVLPHGVDLRRALAALDGDLVYAVKPKAGSLGLGLLAKALTGIPLIADIDDWEMAFFLENPRWLLRNAVEVWNPNNLYTTWAMERMSRRADAITVSTTFLQHRFGGTIIPHARSAGMFPHAAGGPPPGRPRPRRQERAAVPRLTASPQRRRRRDRRPRRPRRSGPRLPRRRP